MSARKKGEKVTPTKAQLDAVTTLFRAGWRFQPGFGYVCEKDTDLHLFVEVGPQDDNAVQGAISREGMVCGLGGSHDDFTADEAIVRAEKWLAEPFIGEETDGE